MSGTDREIDDFDSLDLDFDASANFMVTFAAVGALVLLEMDGADAATPTLAAPISMEDAEKLLRGGPTPLPSSAVIAPVTTDDAFVAAIAAFSAPTDSAPIVLSSTDNSAPAANFLAFADEVTSAAQSDASSSAGYSDIAAAIAAFGSAQLSVAGDNLLIALAADVSLTIAGVNDFVLTQANDTIAVLSGSSVAVQGAGAKVTLAGHDTLSVAGAGYQVQSNGAGNVVNVQQGSQATVTGDEVAANLAGANASATMLGSGNQVVSTSANTTLNIGGNGQAAIGGDLSSADSASLMSGDVANLFDNSTLYAYGAGQLNFGANDFMLIGMGGAFDLFAPEMMGLTVISDFGGGDLLHLHSAFNDIADLLGGAIQSNGATTLYLDSFGNSLTFAGVEKSQLASYAAAGRIDLY